MSIGVDADELNSLDPCVNHAVNCVGPASSHTDYFEICVSGLLFDHGHTTPLPVSYTFHTYSLFTFAIGRGCVFFPHPFSKVMSSDYA